MVEKNPLKSSIRYLRGIGEQREVFLEKMGVETVEDLLEIYPRRYLDRRQVVPIRDLRAGTDATVIGKVTSFRMLPGRKSRFVLRLYDGTGELNCVWFKGGFYLKNKFQLGEELAVSGKVRLFGGFQMTHPDTDRISDFNDSEKLSTGKILPQYPTTRDLVEAGLDSRGLRRILYRALLDYSSFISENLPEALLRKYNFPGRRGAINAVHFPVSGGQLRAAIQRLKFEELFFMELMLAYRRWSIRKKEKGIAFVRVGKRTRNLVEQLPFQLTETQKRVIREIWTDMKNPAPMNRLLQGDVGSGKTVVALVAMLLAVENGYQAALMAPTEILAEQHYLTFYRMLEHLGVKVALLTGGQKKKQKEETLKALREGKTDMAIGTHALIQGTVAFRKLGLVVIDEQHRFGVLQRAGLRAKGTRPDVLVMTATPIPRTLSLTVYGDLDISILDEKPANRKPVITTWRPEKNREEIYKFVRKSVEAGRQAYVVFPLVEESEKLDLRAAAEAYEAFRTGTFKGISVGLIHGRMKAGEKETLMEAFKQGKIQVLVCTTVIEVGVDVPNAAIMVIEHAERFGLTQLHQLRGRVGRGTEQAYCILLAYSPISKDARERLQAMKSGADGFKLAEVDLKMRGPGEYFGTRQHGLPNLKLANVIEDAGLLLKARQEAFQLVKSDPPLKMNDHPRVREFFLERYRDKYGLIKIG
ncbi:ATP-dependent DNA helicase RecG [bacterium BMS3Abin05]|nr:ATP-dependent DNA helicase RecG [bacterium BMS3Abin05]